MSRGEAVFVVGVLVLAALICYACSGFEWIGP